MKKSIMLLAALGFGTVGFAQEPQIEVPEGYVLVDTIVYRTADVIERELKGKNIFDLINSGEGTVRVVQEASVKEGMARHIEANKTKKLSGYRVRIFFENTQNARAASEDAAELFEKRFPGYNSYRTFANPFFKVTVGDFRTKSEATVLLGRVKRTFPSATVVREKIEYPQASSENTYVVDTIQVLRPLENIEL